MKMDEEVTYKTCIELKSKTKGNYISCLTLTRKKWDLEEQKNRQISETIQDLGQIH
jgi:hypothetical protein